MNSVDRFLEAAGWSWQISSRPATRTLVEQLRATGWTPAVVRGRRCPTKAALLDELADVLQFPGWFGHNWDALVDCLRDATANDVRLAIVVTAGSRVGVDEPDAPVLSTLASIIDDLADEGTAIKLATR